MTTAWYFQLKFSGSLSFNDISKWFKFQQNPWHKGVKVQNIWMIWHGIALRQSWTILFVHWTNWVSTIEQMETAHKSLKYGKRISSSYKLYRFRTEREYYSIRIIDFLRLFVSIALVLPPNLFIFTDFTRLGLLKTDESKRCTLFSLFEVGFKLNVNPSRTI